MAIRNDLLGGTDWTTNEKPLKAVDLNDTFDAAATIVKQNPGFWLSSTLYDVYDDFDSETPGAFTTNTDWTISASGVGTATIVTSNNANGGSTGNELKLGGDSGSGSNAYTATATSINIVSNRHTHVRLAGYYDQSTSSASYRTIQASFDGGTTYYSILNNRGERGSGCWAYSDFTVVAKGSDEYDLYGGGRLLASAVTIASPQLSVRMTAGAAYNGEGYLYVDDVVQNKVDVV